MYWTIAIAIFAADIKGEMLSWGLGTAGLSESEEVLNPGEWANGSAHRAAAEDIDRKLAVRLAEHRQIDPLASTGAFALGTRNSALSRVAGLQLTSETRLDVSSSARPSSESSYAGVIVESGDPGQTVREDGVREEHVISISRVREENATQVLAVLRDVGPMSYRRSPWTLMGRDLAFFIRNVGKIHKMFGSEEGPRSPTLATAGHIVMIFVSIIITILCLAALVTSVGLLIVVLYAFAGVSHKFQGERTLNSKGSRTLRYGLPANANDSNTTEPPKTHTEREQWFFVNGIGTLPSGAQAVIDHLHEQTGRPVKAIHNRSLGAWFDLVECILMRDLHINTANIRNGYKYIYDAIADPTIEKVVLICHSQGGIIVTAWVDQLITDWSREMLRKLEIYTFASAADHFSRAYASRSTVDRGVEKDGLFGRVEHFANDGDFVAQYGVLNRDIQETSLCFSSSSKVKVKFGRFTGQRFIRQKDGHSLLGHYLCSEKPENSILREPAVRDESRLSSYLDGESRLPGHSWMEDANRCVTEERGRPVPNPTAHYSPTIANSE